MDADDVRVPKDLVLRDKLGAHLSGACGREVLAPGDDVHAKGLADARDRAPDVAEPEKAQRLSTKILANAALPSPAAQ